MNIIAELKPPHRTEIRSMLSDYGFLCMKYVEAYDMVLPSDRRVIMDNGRMAIDQSILGESRTSIAYYGIRCDESHPASDHLTGTEVIQSLDLISCCNFRLSLKFCIRITGLFEKTWRIAFGAIAVKGFCSFVLNSSTVCWGCSMQSFGSLLTSTLGSKM
jgi:hypothetical protein